MRCATDHWPASLCLNLRNKPVLSACHNWLGSGVGVQASAAETTTGTNRGHAPSCAHVE